MVKAKESRDAYRKKEKQTSRDRDFLGDPWGDFAENCRVDRGHVELQITLRLFSRWPNLRELWVKIRQSHAPFGPDKRIYGYHYRGAHNKLDGHWASGPRWLWAPWRAIAMEGMMLGEALAW